MIAESHYEIIMTPYSARFRKGSLDRQHRHYHIFQHCFQLRKCKLFQWFFFCFSKNLIYSQFFYFFTKRNVYVFYSSKGYHLGQPTVKRRFCRIRYSLMFYYRLSELDPYYFRSSPGFLIFFLTVEPRVTEEALDESSV